MTYEPDSTPEEFAQEIEEAIWAVVSPEEKRMMWQSYQEGGREELTRHVTRNLRDDIDERYVDAMVDGMIEALKDSFA